MAYFTLPQQMFYQNMMANQGQGLMPPQFSPMTFQRGSSSVARSIPEIPPTPPMSEESPVARGLSSGMGAARESMDIDQSQHDRLMGLAIAKMFGGMGGNKGGSILGGLNQGLSGGIDDYMRQRAVFAKMNAMEMERQDRLAREEMARQERELQRKELRDYRNKVLSLKSQSHNPLLQEQKNGMDFQNLPELDKSTRSKYSIDYKGTGKLLSEIKSIKEGIKELKESENEDGSPLISQANPYLSGIANPVKDIMGRGKGKLANQLNKERLARESVNSKLQKFRLGAERALKGGQLTQGIYDRFEKMKTFPDLKQGYDTVENLLNDIEKEAFDIHKASEMSLKSGRQVTPYELEQTEAISNQQNDMDSKIKKARELGFTEEEINAILQE